MNLQFHRFLEQTSNYQVLTGYRAIVSSSRRVTKFGRTGGILYSITIIAPRLSVTAPSDVDYPDQAAHYHFSCEFLHDAVSIYIRRSEIVVRELYAALLKC
jgi:hypothetical protein